MSKAPDPNPNISGKIVAWDSGVRCNYCSENVKVYPKIVGDRIYHNCFCEECGFDKPWSVFAKEVKGWH